MRAYTAPSTTPLANPIGPVMSPSSGPWLELGLKIIGPKKPSVKPRPPSASPVVVAHMIRTRLRGRWPRQANHQPKNAADSDGARRTRPSHRSGQWNGPKQTSTSRYRTNKAYPEGRVAPSPARMRSGIQLILGDAISLGYGFTIRRPKSRELEVAASRMHPGVGVAEGCITTRLLANVTLHAGN